MSCKSCSLQLQGRCRATAPGASEQAASKFPEHCMMEGELWTQSLSLGFGSQGDTDLSPGAVIRVEKTLSERATQMLAELGLSGARQQDRIAKLAAVLQEHPDARLEQCGDENTGRRYGLAQCRLGRCEKIGSTTYQYQLWAVW